MQRRRDAEVNPRRSESAGGSIRDPRFPFFFAVLTLHLCVFAFTPLYAEEGDAAAIEPAPSPAYNPLSNGTTGGKDSMAQAIRVAILGAGRPGVRHAEGYKAAGGFQIAAVADLIPQRRKAVMDAFGVTREVADAAELMTDPNIDAVSVCLPNHLHLPIALAALKDKKHVLCETPPALSAGEAKRLAAAAAKAGRVLLYAAQRRFGGSEQAARQAMKRVTPARSTTPGPRGCAPAASPPARGFAAERLDRPGEPIGAAGTPTAPSSGGGVVDGPRRPDARPRPRPARASRGRCRSSRRPSDRFKSARSPRGRGRRRGHASSRSCVSRGARRWNCRPRGRSTSRRPERHGLPPARRRGGRSTSTPARARSFTADFPRPARPRQR